MRYFFVAMIVFCGLCVFGVNIEDAEATKLRLKGPEQVEKFSPVRITFVSERTLLSEGSTLVLAPSETTLQLVCLQRSLPELKTRTMFISQGLSFYCKIKK